MPAQEIVVKIRNVDCPEHEKLEAIKGDSQACGEFLEWLHAEKGWSLCCIPPEYQDTYVPVHYSTERLLAEYFKVDLSKIEDEKRAVLAALREAT